MNIDIEIDNEIYECLLLLAAKKQIPLKILIERYLMEMLADYAGTSSN